LVTSPAKIGVLPDDHVRMDRAIREGVTPILPQRELTSSRELQNLAAQVLRKHTR
jgi:hypothetical protein